jgi:hypothetical protein
MPIGQAGRKNDILKHIFRQKSLLNLHYVDFQAGQFVSKQLPDIPMAIGQ